MISLAKNCLESSGYFDYLYKPCPDQPADTATEAEKAAFRAEYKKHSDVACIMLGKMSPALQRQFENYTPQNIMAELRKMFEKPPAVEIYDLVDALHSCRQAPGKPVKGKSKADKNNQVVPYQPKPKPNPLKRTENPNEGQACHHCHIVGHWKRNCPLYLEELRANKKSEPSAAIS
nr:zinc finger, CCHC-type [Tanacetum cinerariifolium]